MSYAKINFDFIIKYIYKINLVLSLNIIYIKYNIRKIYYRFYIKIGLNYIILRYIYLNINKI